MNSNLIKIIPLSSRAKNRVAEHGDMFILEKREFFQGKDAILVRSLKETWGSAGRKQQWLGWFTVDEIVFDFQKH